MRSLVNSAVLNIVISFFLIYVVSAQPIGLLGESIAEVTSVSKFENEPLLIKKCIDFDLTGKGNNPEWKKAEWNSLAKLDKEGKDYESKFKILYSTTGIYVLFQGQDDKITTKSYKDFENIFDGDVFEVFFHPNPLVIVYFEYEVNQLDKQLILTISNSNGQGNGWVPWQPDKNASGIQKMVNVVGGNKDVNGAIQSWSAEIYFPFSALGLLPNVPPKSGTVWNANFCRLDYDSGNMIKYSWTPTIKVSFHELNKFRSIKFE
ncbi:MAG: carbohydrate-binding family 9-like protein [Bacteroidota bacterium]